MIAGYVHAMSTSKSSYLARIKKAAVDLYLPCLYFSFPQWVIMSSVFAVYNPANFGAAKLSDLFAIPLIGFKEYWFLAVLFFVKALHITFEHTISSQKLQAVLWIIIFLLVSLFRKNLPLGGLRIEMGIYFHAGYLMKQNNVFTCPKILHGLLLIIVGTCCFCARYVLNAQNIFTAAGSAFCISTGLFIVFYAMKVNNSVLKVYGLYSMVVYCLHNYAAASLRMLFTVSGLSSSASPVILAAIGIIFAMTIPLAVVWLYKNVKCLRWIEYIFYPRRLFNS